MMLLQMAQMNPGYLQQMGASPKMLMDELKKYEKYEELSKVEPAAKSAGDKALWKEWLSR